MVICVCCAWERIYSITDVVINGVSQLIMKFCSARECCNTVAMPPAGPRLGTLSLSNSYPNCLYSGFVVSMVIDGTTGRTASITY